MKKNLNRLVVAFLIVFFNLLTPMVSAEIIAKGLTTPLYQGLDIDVFYQMNRVQVAQHLFLFLTIIIY